MFVLEVTDKAFLVLDNGSLLIDDLFLFANLFLELLFTLVGLGNGFFVAAHSLIEHKLLLLELISNVFVVLEFSFVFKHAVLEVDLVLFEFLDGIFFLGDSFFKLIFFEEDLLHGIVLTE
jgi:hypothetical protein